MPTPDEAGHRHYGAAIGGLTRDPSKSESRRPALHPPCSGACPAGPQRVAIAVPAVLLWWTALLLSAWVFQPAAPCTAPTRNCRNGSLQCLPGRPTTWFRAWQATHRQPDVTNFFRNQHNSPFLVVHSSDARCHPRLQGNGGSHRRPLGWCSRWPASRSLHLSGGQLWNLLV